MAIEIELTPVESSICSAVGYDKEKQKFTVVYHGGNTYVYEKITPLEYSSLFAKSIVLSFGQQLKVIIKGKPYRKI